LIFGDTEGTMLETIAIALLDHPDIGKPAINLVRRGKDNTRPTSATPRTLQNVQRSRSVYFKIGSRVVYRARNRNLARQMEDYVSVFNYALHRGLISNVFLYNA
jgi:hypothetical protein